MEEGFTAAIRRDTGHWWIDEPGGLVMERVYRDYVSDEAADLVLASEGWERTDEALAGGDRDVGVFGIRRTAGA